MALSDITNKTKEYHISVRIDSKYAPLIKRGVNLESQVSTKEFPRLRKEGATNLDLWISGNIYLEDPRTSTPPEFTTIKDLLIVFCKGESGLLGCVRSLHQHAAEKSMQIQTLQDGQVTLLAANQRLEQENSLLLQQLLVSSQAVVTHEHTMQMLEMRHFKELEKKEAESKSWQGKYEKQLNEPFAKKRKSRCQINWKPGYGKQLKKKIRSMGGNEESATVLSEILTMKQKNTMLLQPSMQQPLLNATNQMLQQVGNHIGPSEVLSVCDQYGVSQKGFSEIRKTYKQGLKLVNPKLKCVTLPNAHKVATLRRQLNDNLHEWIGKWTTIEAKLPDSAPTRKGKGGDGSKARSIQLSAENCIIADLEAVQRKMVQFYDVTMAELNGEPLKFVIKMDEAEIVKNRKYERVGIILMNRALDPTITPSDPRYFSVQSDENMWLVLCCEVSKESYQKLEFIFSKTNFPNLMKAQESGQLLEVSGMGTYAVEWHLAADMKTIKCLYGFKHGANAKLSCIYCLQEKTRKEIIEDESAAQRINKKRQQHGWKGGLFSVVGGGECPSRGSTRDIDFHPILPIPLTRVHICTLHANVKIVEKMLHLHFLHVWTMEDKAKQKQAIEEMEKSLSLAGVHKGKVRIFKDPKLSGTTGSVPNKLSMNGAHVRALFKKSKMTSKDKVWMDLCDADHHINPSHKLIRLRLWQAYEELQPYFKGLTLKDQQLIEFKTKVHKWGKLFVDTFGEEHVTHYIHVLVKHAPWFIAEYGSLSVWSTQGMERSHSTAKTTFGRHTQHGGGKGHISAVLQTYEHDYRKLHHHQVKKNKLISLENAWHILYKLGSFQFSLTPHQALHMGLK